MMYGSGYGMMGDFGWLGVLFMLLFGALVLVGIVLLVVWMVRASTGGQHMGASASHSANTGHDEAIAVARRRLASGEISKEQYEEIMRTLGG